MAGFYGNISKSNRTAFTFDITYATRAQMDTACATDGVFIGRYVLVEYDDPPITGYYDYDTGKFYTDSHKTHEMQGIDGRLYQDLNAVDSTQSFYVYDGSLEVFQHTVGTSVFGANYNRDVAKYGRGYDSTAWIKTVDAQTGKYRYVLVAELNTVVPNFHLVAEPPSGTPIAPFFDSNTTSLDYYLHAQANWGVRIASSTNANFSDELITWREDRWDQESKSYYEVTPQNPEPGDIFYNRAGFLKQTRTFINTQKQYVDENFESHPLPTYPSDPVSVDSINYTFGKSGRLYGGADETGSSKDDMMLWHVYLPSIGNAICEVWDNMFTTQRKLAYLREDFNNLPASTVDTDSVLGMTNSMRAYMGRVYLVNDEITDGYTAPSYFNENHTSIGFVNGQDTRTYYYPTFASIWTEDDDGDYYFDQTVQAYRVANKAALPAGVQYYSRTTENENHVQLMRYKEAFTRDITGISTGGAAAVIADRENYLNMPNTIYGAIAYINRLIGTGLFSYDTRDERTVIGLMNIMRDTIANIDTQLAPSRWLITDSDGKIITSTVPFTTRIATGVLQDNGQWVSRYHIFGVAQSTAVTELTTDTGTVTSTIDTENKMTFASANKWIRFATDDTNKIIKIAHVLNGIGADTLTPTETGWGNAAANSDDNELVLPVISFDQAGHITGTDTVTFYLPNSFKTFSVAAQSTAVANSTPNQNSIVADNSADAFTFATANKWLTIAADVSTDTLTFGHIISGVTAGNYGLAATKTIAQLDTDNTFIVPYFTVDEAGHITAAVDHTISLPENFTTIGVSNVDTETNLNTGASDNVVADTLEDTLILAGSNKWIKIYTDAANDKIIFAHEMHTLTATTPTIDFNTLAASQNTPSTFSADVIECDGAGHMTTRARTTYTLPCAWKTVSTTNSDAVTSITGAAGTITATTQVDGFTIAANNKWLLVKTGTKTIDIAHALSAAGKVENKGTGSVPTSQFGMTFNVPYLSIDEAGHVTALTDTTVTIPTPSLTDATTGNVLTDLSFTASSGALVLTRNNIGALAITGYTTPTGVSTDSIASTDTLNTAIQKLVKRISDEEAARATAISTEVTNRNNAISDAIATEVTNRNNAISDAIATEVTNRNNAIADAVAAEAQARQNAGYLVSSDLSPYLTSAIAAETYQPIEDSNDPYAVESYVDNAIASIFANFSMTLNPITVTAAIDNHVITPSLNSFDGAGIIKLEKIEAGSPITVTDSEQIIEDGQTQFTLDAYIIENNGTYRVAARRSYRGKTSEWSYSEQFVVDDIVPEEPEEP